MDLKQSDRLNHCAREACLPVLTFFLSKIWTPFHCQSSKAGIRHFECYPGSCSDLLISLKQVFLLPALSFLFSVFHLSTWELANQSLEEDTEISWKMVNMNNLGGMWSFCNSASFFFFQLYSLFCLPPKKELPRHPENLTPALTSHDSSCVHHMGDNGCQAIASPPAAFLESASVQSPMTLTCYGRRVGWYHVSFFPIENYRVKSEKYHSKVLN